jgi:hypothetical protein
VSHAIAECQRDHLCSAEAVIQRTRSLAAIEAATRDEVVLAADAAVAPAIHVPRPDLSCFDQLLSSPAAGDAVSVFFA